MTDIDIFPATEDIHFKRLSMAEQSLPSPTRSVASEFRPMPIPIAGSSFTSEPVRQPFHRQGEPARSRPRSPPRFRNHPHPPPSPLWNRPQQNQWHQQRRNDGPFQQQQQQQQQRTRGRSPLPLPPPAGNRDSEAEHRRRLQIERERAYDRRMAHATAARNPPPSGRASDYSNRSKNMPPLLLPPPINNDHHRHHNNYHQQKHQHVSASTLRSHPERWTPADRKRRTGSPERREITRSPSPAAPRKRQISPADCRDASADSSRNSSESSSSSSSLSSSLSPSPSPPNVPASSSTGGSGLPSPSLISPRHDDVLPAPLVHARRYASAVQIDEELCAHIDEERVVYTDGSYSVYFQVKRDENGSVREMNANRVDYYDTEGCKFYQIFDFRATELDVGRACPLFQEAEQESFDEQQQQQQQQQQHNINN